KQFGVLAPWRLTPKRCDQSSGRDLHGRTATVAASLVFRARRVGVWEVVGLIFLPDRLWVQAGEVFLDQDLERAGLGRFFADEAHHVAAYPAHDLGARH